MENYEIFIKFADCRSKVSISWKIHILLQYFNCPAEIFHQAFWNMLSGFRKYFIRLSENIQSWIYFNFWLKYSSPAESVVLSSALLHIPCQGRTLKLCPKCWCWLWTCFLKFNTLKNGAIESIIMTLWPVLTLARLSWSSWRQQNKGFGVEFLPFLSHFRQSPSDQSSQTEFHWFPKLHF